MQHSSYQSQSKWARWSIIAAAALAALALLAGAGASVALGQAKTTAHFIPAQTSGVSEPDAANPAGSRPVITFRPMGQAGTDGTESSQSVVNFTTASNSATYVPSVGFQYGTTYSAGPVSCTQTIVTGSQPYVQNCSVTINTAPQYPGGHRDAFYILDSDGSVLMEGTAFMYSIGFMPQLMIQPGVITSLNLPGNPYLYGSTTDDTGTYYVYANNDFYTVKNSVATVLATSVPRANSLSIDGTGTLFEPGDDPGYSGLEFPNNNAISLCYGLPYDENQNPVIAAASVCFDNPNAVAVGNLGTYYDADSGGESMIYDGQTLSWSSGVLYQSYEPDGPVKAPAQIGNMVWGDQPVAYPIGTNYSPNGMVVDAYENLFFTDANNGIAVWCGFPGVSNTGAVPGSTGCTGWGQSMHLLNQFVGTNPSIAVDAADTLYASQGGIQMFSAANNYASPIAGIGYGGSVALTPDGTVYVGNGSTIDIIDRSQGSINWGSNNGATSPTQTVTLYNGGNQPLTISSITSSGVGYTVGPASSNSCAANGITLASGTICQFLITSAPPHAGTLNGTVTITSNSLNNPATVQTIALTGYTSGIYVTATPSPLVFSSQTVGATLPLTITNTSAGSTAVGYGSTVSITSGPTSTNSAFIPSLGTCSSPLAASGATCQIEVQFNPNGATSFTGKIIWTEQITGGGPSQQMSVNVSAVNGSGTPAITSVSPILPQQTQTITISGSGFGTQSPFNADSSYILVADPTGIPWYAGDTGDAVTLSVASWSDTQIVITGFTGAYGTDAMCIKPGDQLYVKVWNAQTGNGPAFFPITASSGTNTCDLVPSITSVSPILPQQTQTITINGFGFGTHAAYNGDTSSILFADPSGNPAWYAGDAGNAVTLTVASWTDTQIVITGFTGAYGTDAMCIKPGDQLYVKVWNAQTGNGPAFFPITAGNRANTCDLTPTITSVSPILPQQTQTITINGFGFGTQASYNGDSSRILFADSSGTPWYAGDTADAVTLSVSSWTDTQIVLTGFTGQYGTDGMCINPGDQLYIKVWNVQTGNGPAFYPITASGGANTCVPGPTITSVSAVLPQQTQTITITGSGFGTQSAYNGDSSHILFADPTGTPWYGGYPGDSVTLSVSSWTDTQIVITGFTGSYGTSAGCIKPGDQLYVKVWNAQSGSGPAYYPVTAGSGANTCP